MASNRGALADVHFELKDDAIFPDLEKAIRENQVILITGEPHGDERLSSIPAHILTQLKAFVDKQDIPLIIEADGSRKLPIKAPGEKEPVIPDWVNAVAVVAGLSSVGTLASEKTIHRFTHFSKITGINPGEAISFEHIQKMFVHPTGGLKRVPEGARRIALLNQADSVELTAEAIQSANRLLGMYDIALVASLKPECHTDNRLGGREVLWRADCRGYSGSWWGEPLWSAEEFADVARRDVYQAGSKNSPGRLAWIRFWWCWGQSGRRYGMN